MHQLPDRDANARTSLRELALLFLRLGATAFGGPAVHVALMQDEVVRRRGWLTEERFLDLLGVTQLIPGPNSTEMAIHIGWTRRRWAGLFVAGLSFILPAVATTGALGWTYVRFGSLPTTRWLLDGVKPVMLGVVFQALWGLAPRAARTRWLRLLAVLVTLLLAAGVNELVALFGAGAAAVAAKGIARTREAGPRGLLPPLATVLPIAAAASGPSAATVHGLFWVFLKIGSVLFGSGYVLLAFLRADLVERLGWLNEGQLLDAIAVGQLTPGPVFSTATFIGYVLAGPSGALFATAGIFLPAFGFVALSGPWVPRLRESPAASAFLDGVNVASLALMAVVTFQLGRAALTHLPAVVLALVSAVLLIRFRVNATWLVLGGAAAGWALQAMAIAPS